MLGGFDPMTSVGGIMVPTSVAVQDDAAMVRVNNTSGMRVLPAGAVNIINPRWPNADHRGAVECVGSSTDINTIGTGINGIDGQMRFGRVVDPDDSLKMAYYLRLDQGDASLSGDGTKQRLEMKDSDLVGRIQRGTRYWMAIGFRVPDLWKQASPTITGNEHGTRDETLLFQIHENPDSFDVSSNPAVVLTVVGGGVGTPQNSYAYVTIRSNPNLVSTGSSQNTVREVWREYDYPCGVWQYWVFDVLLHWDAAQGPYLKAYRALGSGAMSLMFHDQHPNHYNNTENDPYVKTGMYYYVAAWTGGFTSRVMYHKGLHVWKHRDGMDADRVMTYLRSI